MKKINSLLIAIIVSLSACVDNELDKSIEVLKDVKSNESISGTLKSSNVDFDWEYAEEIFLPSINRNVPTPWAGGNISFDAYIYNDRFKKDGWELLYNLFQTTNDVNMVPSLIFYNKYRGVIRIYWYNAADSQKSNQVTWTLELKGLKENSLANFGNPSIARPMDDRNQGGSIMKITNDMVTQNAWYYNDFEIAYDELASGYREDELLLKISCDRATTENIVMDGRSTGSIIGSVQLNSSVGSLLDLGGGDFSRISNIGISTVTSNVSISEISSELTEAKTSQTNDPIGNAIKKGIDGLLGKLTKSAVNWIADPFIGLFDSFLGSSGGVNPNNVNLSIDTKISLQGQITWNYNYFTLELKIPGAIGNEDVSGVTPTYDNPLGVLNISSTPIVEWDNQVYWKNGEQPENYWYIGDRDLMHEYRLLPNSFNIILNDFAGVRIEKIEKILCFKNYPGAYNSEPLKDIDVISGDQVNSEKNKEKWVAFSAYNNANSILSITNSNCYIEKHSSRPYDNRVLVMVRIKLVPINGNSDPIYWVKTYKPKFVKRNWYDDQYNEGGIGDILL